ncbi:MAG TPA: GntR family transcriptional regulator [Anaerolineales bacterium]|nr:GntR family transcriptional regulator [Anaerolineales bacterium]
MKIALDFRSSEPIYIQIMDQIRQMVATGELQPGDQLPTVRQLAAELRVNFNTIARAYRLLDEGGLISTQQGRGTYIWERPDDENSKRLRARGLHDLAQRYIDEAQRLGYTPQETYEALEDTLQAWLKSAGEKSAFANTQNNEEEHG